MDSQILDFCCIFSVFTVIWMTVSSSFVQCTTVNHISLRCSHHTLGLFSTFLVWLKYCHVENQTNKIYKELPNQPLVEDYMFYVTHFFFW